MQDITTYKKSKVKKIILITVITILVLFVALLVATPFIVMPMMLGQRFEQEQFDSLNFFDIPSERITLKTDDSLSIVAWRTRAEDSKGTVIILSGIENPSVTAFFGYSKMLADNGWDTLLIEMRARSESEGAETGFGMTEWLDVKAGVDFLSNNTDMGELPIVAMGTSMGGATVIIAAGELPEIDAVISISAFSSFSSMFVDYMSMSGIPKVISVLDTPFVNMYLGFHFGFGTLNYSPIKSITKLGERPILLMHSTEDTRVPYSHFETLLKEANKNNIDISTFTREGDNHFMCYEKHFYTPTADTEFSKAVLDFLNANFQ